MSVRIWIYQASSFLQHKFDMKAMAKELLKKSLQIKDWYIGFHVAAIF